MEKLNKPKITRGVSLKDSLSNWQELVYRNEESKGNLDYRFWEESWNDEYED